MLTLLINESNPLDGLFANSTTGGVGTVPDITVADDGQAVSVQSFTRAGGIITDSFVAGDVLHIGIGDGVNAPVCYVALSSASPATGTMPINTAGMVALFAATAANQISLTLAVVRTRGAYTNTIFSAPIVIRRSAINISTAVPTPSILGTGVAAALQVAINTALGFVRLDASARLPAVDGSQLTNLPNTGGVTSITGTANEITVTGTTTPTLSLPAALTFTGKTVTGGTFNSGAFNGTVGATTPTTGAFTTITGTSSATLGTNGGTGGSVILNGTTSGSATINVSAVGMLQFGEFTAVTATLSATLTTTGAYAMITTVGTGSSIFTSGNDAAISTSGNDAGIFTVGPSSHIQTGHSSSYIQTASTFKLNGGTFVTTLSHGATANRAIAFPDAAGTLLLADGSGANLTALNASNISSGTLADARLSANVPLKDAANTFTAANTFSTSINTPLISPTANTLEVRNGTTSQVFRNYGYYADASNYCRFTLDYNEGSNLMTFTTEGAGTRANRNFGIIAAGTGILYLGAASDYRWRVTSTGLIAHVDNTYDIGASGATRPRHLYVGSNGVFGGALSVTGATTLTGNVASSSTTTGTLIVTGGIGVSGSGYFGSNTQSASHLSTGAIRAGTTVQGDSGFFIGASSSLLAPSSAGVVKISDNTGADFNRLQFGGTTSSYPAIKRSSATLAFRLADDSADCPITASNFTASGTLAVTGATSFGGAAAAATTDTLLTKLTSSIADNTATAVLTVTIPNAAHAASLRVQMLGRLGAGGAIGADEATGTVTYDFAIARTAGVNAVVTASTAFGSAMTAVAGAATVTVTAAASAITGAVGASNSFTVQVTIAKSGGASANHTCTLVAEVLNANATGISIA